MSLVRTLLPRNRVAHSEYLPESGKVQSLCTEIAACLTSNERILLFEVDIVTESRMPRNVSATVQGFRDHHYRVHS